MTCLQCGLSLGDDAMFCSKCGTRRGQRGNGRTELVRPETRRNVLIGWLVRMDGPQAGESIKLVGETVSIGRNAGCDAIFRDSTVTERHAEIVQRDHGVAIVDLNSSNGTTVNSTRVPPRREVDLPDQSLIEIGSVTLRFKRF